MDKVRKEKQELHAQFAREIEAAHAQLSQRESELGAKHLNALQQLKDDHAHGMWYDLKCVTFCLSLLIKFVTTCNTCLYVIVCTPYSAIIMCMMVSSPLWSHDYTIHVALSEAGRRKETAVEELRTRLTSQHDDKLAKLSESLSAEISKLNALLADKCAELDLAMEELKRLKSVVAKSEQGLGSATGQVERLRDQLGQLEGELSGTKRELEGSKREISQQKVLIDVCNIVR